MSSIVVRSADFGPALAKFKSERCVQKSVFISGSSDSVSSKRVGAINPSVNSVLRDSAEGVMAALRESPVALVTNGVRGGVSQAMLMNARAAKVATIGIFEEGEDAETSGRSELLVDLMDFAVCLPKSSGLKAADVIARLADGKIETGAFGMEIVSRASAAAPSVNLPILRSEKSGSAGALEDFHTVGETVGNTCLAAMGLLEASPLARSA